MKIGAVFPTTEIGDDPAAVRDWAQAAESLGYDHIVAYDHVLGAVHADRTPPLMGPYTELHPFHEPLTLFAFLAGVTERIELATGVIILPQRQTALVAKQAAQVDLLSGGRLRLGVGTGWNYVEYEALGVSYADRGRRFTEQIELLRRLWTEPVVDYTGAFHRVDRAGMLPLPKREIPIWFGAFAPGPLRRATRLGDGLLFGAPPTPMKPLLEIARGELEKAGRDPKAFGAEAIVDFSLPDSWGPERALWESLGGTHFSVRAMDIAVEVMRGKRVGFQKPQDYIDALERFRREID